MGDRGESAKRLDAIGSLAIDSMASEGQVADFSRTLQR